MNGQQLPGSQEASAGFDTGANNGSGVSTSMNAPLVDTRAILGDGSVPDMPAGAQPAAKRAKMSNTILPSGAPLVLLFSCGGGIVAYAQQCSLHVLFQFSGFLRRGMLAEAVCLLCSSHAAVSTADCDELFSIRVLQLRPSWVVQDSKAGFERKVKGV